jgi:ATP-binding cassette subfamily C (CFTR/MRP) protein 1
MGRILNRLSKDQAYVDSGVVYGTNWTLAQSFSLFMVICFCIYTVPFILLSLPITVYASFKVQQFYLGTSRELIRLESISKSPIIQHFSETLNGISTIRAFGYQNKFVENYFQLIDKNNSFLFYKSGCYCWLAICLEIVSDLILLVSTVVIVYARDYIDPGLSGICLIYVLMLPDDIYYLIAATTNLENCMVSVERVNNMALIESEDQRSRFKDQYLQSSNWPSQGVIEFYKYSARYRPDTDIILNNVSFIIKSHEKVGIMGRTGSGKSSIVNALFRVIESSSGKIFIDGVDTAEIGLDLLRQKLCVIPQDPALFQGTLRENIDLLKQFTDEEILNTLKLVQLDFGDKALEMDIKENASNLSVGQKQLICIARALLRKSKIIILDEATASIDFKTDMIIQQVIKERFEDCTVLTIAHRINTIMNSDRILVLDKGQVVEFDTPQKLQENNSHFCKLANSH